jgi:putative ABC transport system substrate-binding protein
MRRREFLGALGGAAAAGGPFAARAQERVRRIGMVAGIDANDPDAQNRTSAFLQAMQQLGWTDGRNLRVDYFWGQGQPAVMRKHAAELAALAPDAILVSGTAPLGPLLQATRTVPIVFSMLGNPVAFGLVDGLARPGGNATGIAGMTEEMASKRLQLLRQLVPAATAVALLVNPAIVVSEAEIAETEAAARRIGVRLLVFRAGRVEEIDPMLAALRASDAQAVMVPPNALLATQPQMGRVVRAIAAALLPAMYVETDFVAAGGLMTYGPSLAEFGRHSARTVDRILRGAKPADLPVEQPTRFELVINLKTAKVLGVKISDNLLSLADAVIE